MACSLVVQQRDTTTVPCKTLNDTDLYEQDLFLTDGKIKQKFSMKFKLRNFEKRILVSFNDFVGARILAEIQH